MHRVGKLIASEMSEMKFYAEYTQKKSEMERFVAFCFEWDFQ